MRRGGAQHPNKSGQEKKHDKAEFLDKANEAPAERFNEFDHIFDRFASRLRSTPVRENPQTLVGVKGSYTKMI